MYDVLMFYKVFSLHIFAKFSSNNNYFSSARCVIANFGIRRGNARVTKQSRNKLISHNGFKILDRITIVSNSDKITFLFSQSEDGLVQHGARFIERFGKEVNNSRGSGGMRLRLM